MFMTQKGFRGNYTTYLEHIYRRENTKELFYKYSIGIFTI